MRSTNTGTVDVSRDLHGSYGRYIVIRDTADPMITVYYGHLSERTVTVGQHVTAGQVIGRSGSTGNSNGPHLHYEIRIDDDPVNPMPVLASLGVTHDPKTTTWVLGAVAVVLAAILAFALLHQPPPATETATRPVSTAPAEPSLSSGPAAPPDGDLGSESGPSDLPTSEVDDHGDARSGATPYSQPTKPSTSGSRSPPGSAGHSPRPTAGAHATGGTPWARM